MQTSKKWLWALVICLLAGAGCATLKSTKVGKASQSPKASQRHGIAYSLPYAKVRLKLERVDTKPDDKNPGDARRIQQPRAAAKRQAAIQKGGQPIQQPDKDSPTFAATIYNVTIEPVFLPDPRHLFLLNPKFNSLSDDTFGITVTNGLLTTIASTNVDRSGEILIDLAKIAIQSFKIAAGMPSVKDRRPGAVPAKLVELEFDPADPEDSKTAQDLIAEATGLKLDVQRPNTKRFGKWTSLKAKGEPDEFDGFFYRSVLPYTITLLNPDEKSLTSKTLLLPNNAPILSFSPERSPLVNRETWIGLENGTLAQVYISKPSSWLAAVKVPLTILESVVALPTELVQLKLNFSSTNAELQKSRAAELDALRELLEAQRKLLEARTNQTSNPSP